MKFFLVATFIALCTASTVYRGKNVTVGDDGSIYITTSSGKRVEITKSVGYNGQRNIDISISGPNMPTKRIQIDDEPSTLYDRETRGPWSSANSVSEEFRLKRSSKKSQGDALTDICRDYQGPIDQIQFEKFLGKIEKAVQKGEIPQQIYDLLASLDQIGESGVYGYEQGLLNRGQDWYIPRVYGQVPQGVYGNSRYINPSGTTRYVNPLLGQYQQYQQYQPYGLGDLLMQQRLNGLVQDNVMYQTIPTENVLLREYLMGQQQSPVSALWRSLAYQPSWREGRLGQGMLPQEQYLNILRRPQQGIVDNMVQQESVYYPSLGDLVQQQREPLYYQSLGGLVQQQRPIVTRTLGGLVQPQTPIVTRTLGGQVQQPTVLRSLGGVVQREEPIYVSSLGGLVQQQREPIVVGMGQQQREPIVIQGQQRVPQVVY